jgi:hypothetical protein
MNRVTSLGGAEKRSVLVPLVTVCIRNGLVRFQDPVEVRQLQHITTCLVGAAIRRSRRPAGGLEHPIREPSREESMKSTPARSTTIRVRPG